MNRERRMSRGKAARALGVPPPGRFDMPPKHKGCGKRRCHDEAQANAYALWLARRTTTPLRVYHCDDPATGCGGWHVTSRPTWEDR